MKKNIKDIMLPPNEYVVVSEEATLEEAIRALDLIQGNLPPGRQHHREVLIRNHNGEIVGKLGHHGFLAALEPKYGFLGDVQRLSRAGVSTEFMSKMMDDLGFWEGKMEITCKHACNIKIKKVMIPIEESIDENSSLTEAIHRMMMWQILSIIVKRDNQVVGVLRLSDIFSEIVECIKSSD
ncbi:MAG: CBS domain-containing protein [Candidatus Hatepunaea meridiana]|nr:CBS domain-containing protein [Candidatus Hatepunaea meridiana]